MRVGKQGERGLIFQSLCTQSESRNCYRFQRDRDRDRDRPRSRESREGYNTYYSDSPAHDYQFRDRERDLPPRERPLPRYPIRSQPPQHNISPMMPHLVTGGHPPPPLMSLGPPPTDRKDYYDSYNRYFRLNSILIHVHVKQTANRYTSATNLVHDKVRLRNCG